MRRRPTQAEPFSHGKDSYVEAFERLLSSEPTRHTSLLAIVRLDSKSTLPEYPGDEQLRLLGYEQYVLYGWDHGANDDGYGIPAAKNTGATLFVRDNVGRTRAIVTIKDSDVPSDASNREETVACNNLVILFHELGHVDDAEKRINIVPGRPGKPKEAELYAHHYACKRMMKENLSAPLAIYITGVIDPALQQDVMAVRDAALEFKESSDFKMYWGLAARFFTDDYRRRNGNGR